MTNERPSDLSELTNEMSPSNAPPRATIITVS